MNIGVASRYHVESSRVAVEPSSLWQTSVSSPVIGESEAHLWQADLDVTAPLRRWECYLSPEEKARAKNLRFALSRDRFVVARGLLRELLALYTRTHPAQLRFGCGAYGKPFLLNKLAKPFFYNVSHSGDKAIFAFAAGGDVGIDIERIRANFDFHALEKAFSPEEKRALSSSHDVARQAVKFWTRKEAYVKANGRGLSQVLHHLDVSHLDASFGWSRVKVWHEESREWREDTHWNLCSLPLSADYEAAVVTQNQLRQVSCWRWNP